MDLTLNNASLANLAITQLVQATLLVLVAALCHRLLADRTPRLMLALWGLVAVKALTPPLFASSLGLFSWAQASAVATATSNGGIVAIDWVAAAGPAARWFPTLGVIWALGSSVYFLNDVISRWRLEQALRRDALDPDNPLVRYVAGLAERYELSEPDRVAVSRDELGPAVAGVFRQTLVLPGRLVADQDPAILRPVLLHELVHTSRRDTLVAVLYTAVRMVWWFNPLIWFAARRAEMLVERCVDLTVTRDLQTSLLEYGRGLLRVLELRVEGTPWNEVAGLRPCQITNERLNYLRDANPEFAARPRHGRATAASRWALVLSLGLALLPALPVDALLPRCEVPLDRTPLCLATTEQGVTEPPIRIASATPPAT